MAQIGSDWSRSVQIGPDWPRLAQITSDYRRLAQICPDTPRLAQICLAWPRLAQIGPDWPRLAQIVLDYTRLAQIGPYWSRPVRLVLISSGWHMLAQILGVRLQEYVGLLILGGQASEIRRSANGAELGPALSHCRSVAHRFSNRVRGSLMFPVRAQAQGSLCVFSQPLGCSPRGPVGWPQRISFPTFKGKSSPSGMPTAVPGGIRYRSAASLEEYTVFASRKIDDIYRV